MTRDHAKSTQHQERERVSRVRSSPGKKQKKSAKRRLRFDTPRPDYDKISKLEQRMVYRNGDKAYEVKRTTIGFGDNAPAIPTTPYEWFKAVDDLFCDEEL